MSVVDLTGKPTDNEGVVITPTDFANLKTWMDNISLCINATTDALAIIGKRLDALEGRKRWWR